ncbi:hypothetical protein D9C73_008143 [Collichthys lucidus]|uniref:HECT domain-containing protein n=1 Tax=Collichthys lucidus TaxID=240159 RepID=A0A4V6ANT0_COLLU|nr:hypothetical protein D9C73_008143 [Collichthys lucidus]
MEISDESVIPAGKDYPNHTKPGELLIIQKFSRGGYYDKPKDLLDQILPKLIKYDPTAEAVYNNVTKCIDFKGSGRYKIRAQAPLAYMLGLKPAPSEAVRLLMEDLRRGGDHQPPLRLTLNAGDTDEEWDGTLISFYKQRRETCQWAADSRCSILGNAGVTAIFEGQREHLVPNLCTTILESDLFAMAGRMVGHSSIHGGPSLSGLSPAVLDALTRGTKDIVTSKLCLEDCPEIEVRDTISLVLGRANAQIKQFRKGIKETGIWPLLTARPDVLPLLFPCETDVELTPQASIDSDDSEDEMSTTNINLISGFFRAFVKEASSDVLKGLMKFWTGWELPSPRLTFKVVRSRGHHHLPIASTCYERLRIPDHYKSGSALKLDLYACIESVQSGFGLI